MDDERIFEFLSDEQADVLREVKGALKAMDKYESDETIKKAISDTAAELESALAIPTFGGEAVNAQGQEEGQERDNGWDGGDGRYVG